MWNKFIILIEVIVLIYFTSIIYLDWYLNANVRDIFSMMIISEIGIELYLRLKNKTNGV